MGASRRKKETVDVEGLMPRFLKFARRWRSNRLVFNVHSEASRTECTERVRQRIVDLFVGEFVPLARDIVNIGGAHRFKVGEEPPERSGPDDAKYAWWLTNSHDTREAARRILSWAANAQIPALAHRGPQEGDRMGRWARNMFLCAVQPGEPDVVRGINQWLHSVRTLLNGLLDECGAVRYVVNMPGSLLTSKQAYRSWQLHQDGAQSPTAIRLAEVPKPCEVLVNLMWESDVIPVNLSVAAVTQWFDFYISIPKTHFGGGRLHEWQSSNWPQDAAAELHDAFRLLDALVDQHGWNDAPVEPAMSCREISARDALIEFKKVWKFARTKIDDGKWLRSDAKSASTVRRAGIDDSTRQQHGDHAASAGKASELNSGFPPDDSWHFEAASFWYRKKQYDLNPMPLALLRHMIKSPLRDFSREHLKDNVWGEERPIGDDNVRKTVGSVRTVLRQVARSIGASRETIKDPLPAIRGGVWSFILPKA